MASQALAGREQWAIFIAYIGALRMTLNGGAQAVRVLASVSRYYPQIVRYVLFVKDMQKIDATDFARVRRGDKLILGTLANGQDVIAEAGDCLALLTLDTFTRWNSPLSTRGLPHSTAPIADMPRSSPPGPRKNPADDCAHGLRQAWRRGRRTSSRAA